MLFNASRTASSGFFRLSNRSRRMIAARTLAVAVLAGPLIGCQTSSKFAQSNTRPEGGVAQVDKKRWSDMLRPRPRVDKVEMPVWEVPDRETDTVAIQAAYGRWMERAGNGEVAADAYAKVLQSEPNHLDATLGLARIDAANGRPIEAEARFEKALRLAPSNADVLVACGQFDLDRGKVDSAAEKLLRAVELKPDATDARFALAIARTRQGRINEARTLFAASVGQAQAHYNLGVLLKDTRPSQAAAELRKALQIDPTLAPASELLAQTSPQANMPVILPVSLESPNTVDTAAK